MRRSIRSAACAALALAAAPVGADVLDEFVAAQTGSFDSSLQAKHDARYDVAVWHIAEIWRDGATPERWIYTESWLKDAERPYMQRISRLSASADGSIVARRYTIPDAARFVGAWQAPERLDALSAEELQTLEGCDAVMVRAGAGRFEGGTLGTQCRNTYKGAAYVISQTILSPDGMTNWDRGISADGELRWGPAAGGYRFRRVGADAACVDPVRMLVYGEVGDRKAFGAYARALAASGLYPKNGGYYEAATPALEVFEGAPPEGRGVIIARFPCLAAAQAFWRSPEYGEIRKLREGIAEFEVLVLPAAQLPKTLAP